MGAPPGPIWVYLGTEDGLRRLVIGDGTIRVAASAIFDNAVRALSVHPTDPADVFVGCGLRGEGLYHSRDGGDSIRTLGFRDRWVWGVTRHPVDPDTIYVGTEPPMLYRSTDGGASFEALDGVLDVESRERWTFFHEPFFDGHLHAIGLHPDRPDRLLAGVEHGGVLRSMDRGVTWTETRGGTDAHRIGIHPDDPDHVFLAAGDGLHESTDGGATWSSIDPLRGYYLHTVDFAPTRPDRIVIYADRHGDPIHLSDDGGNTWHPIGDGLPAAAPADCVRFHPTDPDSLVYAGDVGDGSSQLYRSDDLGSTWMPVRDPFPKVWRLAVAPTREATPSD